MPFSALARVELGEDEPAVDPTRFRGQGDRWPGHWMSEPANWEGEPERRLLAGESWHVIHEAIATLPVAQQRVIMMRDIDGWSAPEVCSMLEVTEPNQRVLLHRARSKVRRALEQYLEGE